MRIFWLSWRDAVSPSGSWKWHGSYIAESTVKKHVSHIYQKMNVYSRKEFRAMVQGGAR